MHNGTYFTVFEKTTHGPSLHKNSIHLASWCPSFSEKRTSIETWNTPLSLQAAIFSSPTKCRPNRFTSSHLPFPPLAPSPTSQPLRVFSRLTPFTFPFRFGATPFRFLVAVLHLILRFCHLIMDSDLTWWWPRLRLQQLTLTLSLRLNWRKMDSGEEINQLILDDSMLMLQSV